MNYFMQKRLSFARMAFLYYFHNETGHIKIVI